MAKRFFSTEIWNEDWFIDMPTEYKLFWYYMLSNCDHSGVFKVNLRPYCTLNQINLSSEKAFELFNVGKERIIKVRQDVWLIPDFFVFQYGPILNLNNNVHLGASNIYKKYNIDLRTIRGLIDQKERTKDKDKDKDILSLTKKSQNENFEENGQFKPSGNFRSQGEELFAYRFSQHDKFKQNREVDS
jgi:hypothetical protein